MKKKIVAALLLLVLLLPGCSISPGEPATFLDGIEGYLVPNYRMYRSRSSEKELGGTKIAFEGTLARCIETEQDGRTLFWYVVKTRSGEWMVCVGSDNSTDYFVSDAEAIHARLTQGAAVCVYATYTGYSETEGLPTCTIDTLSCYGGTHPNNQIAFPDEGVRLCWSDFFAYRPDIVFDSGKSFSGLDYTAYVWPTDAEAPSVDVLLPAGTTRENALEIVVFLEFDLPKFNGVTDKITLNFFLPGYPRTHIATGTYEDTGKGFKAFTRFPDQPFGLVVYKDDYRGILSSTAGFF